MHTVCPPPSSLCQAVEALDSLSSCEKRNLCLRGWRDEGMEGWRKERRESSWLLCFQALMCDQQLSFPPPFLPSDDILPSSSPFFSPSFTPSILPYSAFCFLVTSFLLSSFLLLLFFLFTSSTSPPRCPPILSPQGAASH